MFTGIIEAIGTIKSMAHAADSARVTIDSGNLDLSDVKLGDSIATNGICLTVVAVDAKSFTADVSKETITRTGLAGYNIGDQVNLEKAMLPTTRFGGHIVSGHVDATTTITAIVQQGNSVDYWLNIPEALSVYIAEKGSITVDGVSLTVNSLDADKLRLTIVPHTIAQTIIRGYVVGSVVNIEVDLMARYIERLLTKKASTSSEKSSLTVEHLARNGFIK